MIASATETTTNISPEHRRAVLGLYDQGLYLQAYELARSFAPLKEWRGSDARILAARLAGNLGGPKLGDWHSIGAYRADPTHPDACWYFANYLANRRGPLAAWRFMRRRGEPAGASLETRAHWYSLHGTILGRLRDFDAAEEWLDRAEGLGSDHPWIALERAALFALEDRPDDAERMARKALEMRPWYRPAVQWVAHYLVEKERDQEALDLLTDAGRRMESSGVFGQLAVLQLELKQFEGCRESLDHFERCAPLLEKELGEWLSARRCDAVYHLGQYDEAREHAKKVPGKFYEQIAERLENPPADTRRVELKVGFVRQHHQTCAPATLASICRFWSMPGEHLEMAAAISYAGTPHHSERRWAEENGWRVREFTVTWESAVALLDRGIPFTLTTTEPASAHLQACIGYDARRGTLILRDPSLRNQAEILAEGLFERYRSTGPRGKALVPIAEAHRLDHLDLPDSALYDQIYLQERALEKHDRQSAEEATTLLQALAPDHPLTWHARRTLATYDVDPTQILAALDKLLERFPEDLFLQLNRASCLRELSRREDYLAVLKGLAEQKTTDPICWQRYASELTYDARAYDTARALTRKAIKANPYGAGNYANLAHMDWNQRRFDDALELYRFAFCLEDKDEGAARTYFSAARSRGKTGEAMQMLQRRFDRFGAKNYHPARTLYGALAQLERLPEANRVLDRALELRPDDGELALFVAETSTSHGDFARAETMLERAKGRSQPMLWRRAAAILASARGDTAAALSHWAEVLKVEPIAEDAHRAYVELRADTSGREAALQHLRETCERFPHHFALNKLYLDWLRGEGVQAAEAALRKLIEIHPADAWARRELAWYLLELNRLDEAAHEVEIAGELEPSAVAYYNTRGQLLGRQGKLPEAKEAYRQAIRLSVDGEYAIHELVALSETHVERRDAVLFVFDELVNQVIYGEGLLTFRETALLALEPDELLGKLRSALAARPDLWHAWAAVSRQLVDVEQLDEAEALARQAVERFPLLPALWLDLAKVCRRRKDETGEIEALHKALQINPTWTTALRQLADAHEQRGRFDEAQAILERAIARAPFQVQNHIELAELLWRKGDKNTALERIKHAVELDPGYDQAWDRFAEWSRKLERADESIAAARRLTERRPGEARSWLRLAQAYLRLPRHLDPEQDKERIGACLAAFDQALALNPRNLDFHDQKAVALAHAGRFDDAKAACRPPAWGDSPPLMLRARSAWIDAQQGRTDLAIAAMRDVLKEDPKYYWAWTQLADFFQATNRFDEYLEAAQAMCMLSPHTAVPLAYRGEAKLRSGDSAGGEKDLREALALTPDYALAGFILFDEFLGKSAFEEAEQILAHLKVNVEGDMVTARAIQLYCKRQQRTEAESALKALCLSPDPVAWPLDTAANAFLQAAWREALWNVFGAAAQGPIWNPHLAVVWGERYDPRLDNDLETCLATLQKAIDRNPGNFRLIDLKAELLTLDRRYDAALSFCRGYVGGSFDIFVRGRMAWIERQAGAAEEAITNMERVLLDDPKYLWGWQQLADWYEALEHTANHLRAAERLIELSPQSAVGFSHRAAARRKQGETAGARQDFLKALELLPGDEFSAFNLFAMDYEAGEYAQADEALNAMAKGIHPKEIALRRVFLAYSQDRPRDAVAAAEVLCDPEGGRGHLLDNAAQEFFRAGWARQLEEVVRAALNRPEATIGNVWVKSLLELGERDLLEPISRCFEDHDVSREAFVGMLDALAASGRPADVRRVVDRWASTFADDTWTWGRVGSVFARVKDDAGAAEWLSDWPERQGVEAWMLLNVSLSLRGLDRDREASEVSRFAVREAKADYAVPYHQAWLAFDAAIAGDIEAVEAYFEIDDSGRLDSYHFVIAACARALRSTLTNSDKAQAFDEARGHLAATAMPMGAVTHDAALKRAYQKTVACVAERCGGMRAKLWALWRRWRPLLPPDQ